MDVVRQSRRRPSRKWWALAAIGAALVATTAVVRLGWGEALPSVAQQDVWIGKVERRSLVREVQGRGTLVPEHVEWVTATTPARVAQTLVKPGAVVEAQTVIVELQNGELELAALDAERAAAAAEAALVQLDVDYRNQLLAQESLLASLRSEQSESSRRATTALALADKGLMGSLEQQTLQDRSMGLDERLSHEQKRLGVIDYGKRALITSQSVQVQKLREVSAFRQSQVESLKVRAGLAGVVQEMPLSTGQWVTTGTLLAKVAKPSTLKAQVQIPELSAGDVRVGQLVDLDAQGTHVDGEVVRVNPTVVSGNVTVDVKLTGVPPTGARADTSIVASIKLERLDDVLVVDRPAGAAPQASLSVFRVSAADDRIVERVQVRIGSASVREVEIVQGLAEGDRIILSDMTRHEDQTRLRIN